MRLSDNSIIYLKNIQISMNCPAASSGISMLPIIWAAMAVFMA